MRNMFRRSVRLAGWTTGAAVLVLALGTCTSQPPTPAVRTAATEGPPPAAGTRHPPADHTKDRKGIRHKPGSKQAATNCSPCHGQDLKGGQGPSCYTCHGQEWH